MTEVSFVALLIYCEGAIVLARSLRDNGTKKQLAALVTVDHLEPAAITELKVRTFVEVTTCF